MDRYTRIESYLMNVLSPEDKAAFELEMSQDPQLKADVEAHAKMKSALDGLVEHDVKVVLDAENNQTASDPIPMPTIGRRKFIPIAASVLVLVCAGWWVINNKEKVEDVDQKYVVLYEEYFRAPLENGTRSEGNEELSEQQKQFDKAIDRMEEGNFQDAIDVFVELEKEADAEMIDDVRWYLGLCYLRVGEIEEMKKLEITTENKYKEWRKTILDKLSE